MKRIDADGNKLLAGDTGIYLKLKKEPNNRQIFAFRDGKIVKYVGKNGIMKAGGGMLGFNYYALQWLAEHKRLKTKPIYVRMGKKYYKVMPSEILEKKIFLHFKSDGFELQCFYPIKELVKA
jgi:hypothetical protein